MRYLQRAGLVSTLLIGGVLGGLIAPLHSEAGTPQITLQIDGNPATGIPLLGAKLTSCSAADAGLGYTDCYAILTSNTTAYEGSPLPDGTKRYWRVQVAPNQTARLRIGDNVGQDFASLIGVAFVPVKAADQAVTVVTDWGNVSPTYANTLEEHVLTIKTTNNFDSTVNVNNATGVAIPNSGTPPKLVGQVAHGLRSGGEFDAGPLNVITKLCVATTTTNGVITVNLPATAAKCDAVNNKATFTGVGKFTTNTVDIVSPAGSANNSQALSLTVGAGSKELPKVNWPGNTNATLGQVDPTYPRFDCISSADRTQCKPSMTYTMTATMKGPDTFVVTGGPDHFSANCTTEGIKGFNKLITILASVVAAADRFEIIHPNQNFRALINDAKAFLAIFNTPTDPTCPGANAVRVKMFIAALQDQFVYMANGSVAADIAPPPPMTGTITITKKTHQEVFATFHFTITGPSPSDSSIAMGGQSGNSIVVTVLAGTYSISEVPLAGWTLDGGDFHPYCNVGELILDPASFVVPSDGNVSCSFSNTKTPPTGTGTITINERITPLGGYAPFMFGFTGTGVGIDSSFTILTNVDGAGHKTFSGLDTGAVFSEVTIKQTSLPPLLAPGSWGLLQISCDSFIDSSTHWSISDGKVTVDVLEDGDTLTCTFDNHFEPGIL